MRKFLFILLAFYCPFLIAQQQETYLLFEWMEVDNEQESSYAETENFWEKIHQQQAKDGDIMGWDLWILMPGGENQHFQYLTVHLYNDAEKMFNGFTLNNILASAKKAYPEMSEYEIMDNISQSSKTRNLAARVYLQLSATTTGDFDMPIGTVARINMMKTNPGMGSDYVKAETEVFQPTHQKNVDAGILGSWGLASVMVPWGSDVYANYYTFDMFKDIAQFLNYNTGSGNLTAEEQKKVDAGIATRDIKWGYLGKLIKKVR